MTPHFPFCHPEEDVGFCLSSRGGRWFFVCHPEEDVFFLFVIPRRTWFFCLSSRGGRWLFVCHPEEDVGFLFVIPRRTLFFCLSSRGGRKSDEGSAFAPSERPSLLPAQRGRARLQPCANTHPI